MMRDAHVRFEIVAGAIALGEATPAEHAAFAEHYAACARCRATVGSDADLLAVRNIVVNAREGETWTPDLSAPVRVRMYADRHRKVKLAFGGFGVAVAASLALHFAIGSGFFARVQTAISDPPTITYQGRSVTLEPRSVARDRSEAAHRAQPDHTLVARAAPAAAQTVVLVAQPPSLTTTADQVVVKRAVPAKAKAEIAKPSTAQRVIAQLGAPALAPRGAGAPALGEHVTVRPGAGDVPAFAPGQKSAANVVGATPQDASAAMPIRGTAPEVVAVAPSYISRDPVPEGGESSIPADYSELARDAQAEGTVGVEVAVDVNGTAQSCTIVSSSGFMVLDDLMCKAVKKVHFRPAMASGKPVPGTFRFSRTFKLE